MVPLRSCLLLRKMQIDRALPTKPTTHSVLIMYTSTTSLYCALGAGVFSYDVAHDVMSADHVIIDVIISQFILRPADTHTQS